MWIIKSVIMDHTDHLPQAVDSAEGMALLLAHRKTFQLKGSAHDRASEDVRSGSQLTGYDMPSNGGKAS